MASKTPYTAVRKRKIQRKSILNTTVSKQRKKSVTFEKVGETCKGFLRKTWTCYHCSPLYKFNTDETSLRLYSHHLSAYLTSKICKEDCLLASQQSFGITARFSVVEGFATLSGEPDAVKIILTSEDKKRVQELFLCSVDVPNRYPVNLLKGNCSPSAKTLYRKDFRFLPVLIYNGYTKPCQAVISWLEDNFDCSIRPTKFNSIDLTWMVSMWTSIKYIPTNKRKSFLTEFVWKIPVEGLGLDLIRYQIAPDSTDAIWKSIKKSGDNEMSLDNVETFISLITSHVKGLTNIFFDALQLKEISTPFAMVRSDGKIKIGSEAHVHTVLAHLCSLSAERSFPSVTD